jgi:hypothetical protein
MTRATATQVLLSALRLALFLAFALPLPILLIIALLVLVPLLAPLAASGGVGRRLIGQPGDEAVGQRQPRDQTDEATPGSGSGKRSREMIEGIVVHWGLPWHVGALRPFVHAAPIALHPVECPERCKALHRGAAQPLTPRRHPRVRYR